VAVEPGVVQLGAVGGVVVDHRQQRQPEPRRRRQLGGRREEAAVADGGDGEAVGAREGGAETVGEGEAVDWWPSVRSTTSTAPVAMAAIRFASTPMRPNLGPAAVGVNPRR
jgi:hypothetical protein